MYAVLKSGPPKQIFVVSGSPVGTNSTDPLSGEMTGLELVVVRLLQIRRQTFQSVPGITREAAMAQPGVTEDEVRAVLDRLVAEGKVQTERAGSEPWYRWKAE